MAKIKHFIVVGLGSFGSALARKLVANGCRVSAVDSSSEQVEELKDELYEALIGDATERETLQHLPIDEADSVCIGLGEDITQSLLATLHAKELGAKKIIAKGVTKEHGRILKRIGVDQVIFPETEMAEQLADRITWTNVLDLVAIDPEYSFCEIAVPSELSGKTLIEADVRKRFGVWIVGIKEVIKNKLQMFPPGEFKLIDDQIMLVVGKHEHLEVLRELN